MTARDRRALLLGAAIVGVAVLALRVIPWSARQFVELRQSTKEQQATLARARSVLADRLAVRDSFERVVAGIVGLAPHLLDGRTSPDAQATLAALLSLAASRHAVRVLRVDPMTAADSSMVFRRALVHAEVESDVAGMLKFIRALETADPVLTIASIQISASTPSPSPKAPEMLRGELTVAGYYLPRNP